MDANKDNGSNGEYELYKNEHVSTVTECSGGTWRLFVGTQIVFPGDTISWNAKHSDLLFGFPADMIRYFDLEEGQFEEKDENKSWPYKEQERMYESTTYVQYVEKGDSLILKVREDLFNSEKEETSEDKIKIVYDIYVLEDGEFVVGNSSPEMIIQRPYST